MNYMTAVVGEQLTWLRQSEALKVTVLAMRMEANGACYAHLKVEGWCSTDWALLEEGRFMRGHNWRLWKGNLKQVEAA